MSGKLLNSMPVFMSLLVIAGLAFALCASILMPSNEAVHAFSGADNGKGVSVRNGETIKISLEENPTTGYSWNEAVTSGLTIVDSKYTQGDSGLIGAGGVREWTIRATEKGEQQFSAVYKRPWEPIAGNETTFTLSVSVV